MILSEKITKSDSLTLTAIYYPSYRDFFLFKKIFHNTLILLFIHAFYGNIMNGIMASYKIRVKDVVPFIDAIKQYLP